MKSVLPKYGFAVFIPGSLESSVIFISNILVVFSDLAVLFSDLELFGLHLIKVLLGSIYVSHISNEIEFSVSLEVFPLKYSALLNSFVSWDMPNWVFSLTLIHKILKSW